MASANISCFETASNSVMHDRACGQNEARAFDQARSEQVMLQVCDGLGARADHEALRHGAEAEAGDLRR